MVYDAHNEVACLMLGSMPPELHGQLENSSPYEMLQELKSMFNKQAGVERFNLIQTFHACKKEKGKSVSSYVLKMKGYVEQLERLGYVLPQDLSVGLILNGLTSDFAGFVRNYNMHNMGRQLVNYMLCLLRKGKGKDKSYIPKPKKLKPYAKEHPTKDDACHHCKEVGNYKRNCPAYLAELIKKKKQVGTANSSDREGEYISQELKDYLKAYENVQKLTPPYTPQHNGDYALDTATRILNMVPTKKADKTTYELWYEKVPNLSYLMIWGCEALVKRDTPDKL
ncbi:retrotransposon protein, putative, ty1-copia subclass [Tanacetum coccineum]